MRLDPDPGADGPLEPPVGQPGEASQERRVSTGSRDHPRDPSGGGDGEHGGEGEVEGQGERRAQQGPLEAVRWDGLAEGADGEGGQGGGLALGGIAREGLGLVSGRGERRRKGLLFLFGDGDRRLRRALDSPIGGGRSENGSSCRAASAVWDALTHRQWLLLGVIKTVLEAASLLLAWRRGVSPWSIAVDDKKGSRSAKKVRAAKDIFSVLSLSSPQNERREKNFFFFLQQVLLSLFSSLFLVTSLPRPRAAPPPLCRRGRSRSPLFPRRHHAAARRCRRPPAAVGARRRRLHTPPFRHRRGLFRLPRLLDVDRQTLDAQEGARLGDDAGDVVEVPHGDDEEIHGDDGVRRDTQNRTPLPAAEGRVERARREQSERPPDHLEGLLGHVVHDELGGLQSVGEAEGGEGGARVESRAGGGPEGLA